MAVLCVFLAVQDVHAQLPVRAKSLILRGPLNGSVSILPNPSQLAAQSYTVQMPAGAAPALNAVLQVKARVGTTATLEWVIAPSIEAPVIFEEQQLGSFNLRRRTGYFSGPQATPGLGAFDAQASRDVASQTASGQYSGILGGRSNTASGQLALAVGGDSNRATAQHSVILGGRDNLASDVFSFVGTGYRNRTTNDYALVVGGNYNLADGRLSAIISGDSNSVDGSSDTSTIINGSSNAMFASKSSVILSGNDNRIGQTASPTNNSIILGGGSVYVKSSNTLVWSGTNSTYQIDDANAAVVHNADLVLTNSNSTPSRLTFMEPSSATAYPGDNTISFRAGSMTSNSSYVLPGALGSAGQVLRVASVSGSEATLDWTNASVTLSGAPTQMAFFKTATELSSASDITWDTLNRTLTLVNVSKPSELLSLSKSGAQTSNDTTMSLLNTATSSTTLTKTGLLISSTGSWTGTNIGLSVNVAGGTSNYAATFTGGRVGIGDDTPDATLDLDGDLAYSEYSYTGTLAATNDDVDFDGNDNRFALVRVGTQGSAKKITGFEGGVAGKTFNLINASGHPIIIEPQSTGSAASNRIITADNDNVAIAHRTTAQFVYSGQDSRWYVSATSPSSVVSFPPTDQTITGTGGVLQSSTSAYLRVNNTSATNQDVTLEDGVTVGQVIIVQLITTSAKNITLDGTNLIASASDASLTPGQAVILVWDGTYWQVSAAKGG